jgi:ABC-type Fe3+ transport system permease subunit
MGIVGLFLLGWIAIGDVWARTIGLGLTSASIAVPLGLMIFWVVRSGGRTGKILLLASVVLSFLPMVVHVSGWDAAIGKLGWLSTARGNVLVPLVSGWWAASWIHGIVAAPQIALMLFFCEGYQGRIYEEQALLDAGGWTTFSQVTVWRFAPAMAVATMWVVVSCAREITVVDLYQVETFAEQIYLGYSLGNGSASAGNLSQVPADFEIDYGWQTPLLYVAALALIAAAAVFLLVDLVRPKENEFAVLSSRVSLGTGVAGALLLVLLVLVPLANVIVRASFYVDSKSGILEQKYSVLQALQAVQKSWTDYQLEMFWSLMIALAASTLAVLTSIFLIRIVARSKPRQMFFLFLMAVGLALPGPVVGSWLNELSATINNESLRYLIDYTIFAPVIANVIFTGPLIAMMIWFVLKRTPDSIQNASELDGATVADSFWRIKIAANWIAIIGCWILGCVLCFGELAASQMVRPAGMDTVARKMLGDLHAGVNELTAGATMVMAAIAVGLAVVGWFVVKCGMKRT